MRTRTPPTAAGWLPLCNLRSNQRPPGSRRLHARAGMLHQHMSERAGAAATSACLRLSRILPGGRRRVQLLDGGFDAGPPEFFDTVAQQGPFTCPQVQVMLHIYIFTSDVLMSSSFARARPIGADAH